MFKLYSKQRHDLTISRSFSKVTATTTKTSFENNYLRSNFCDQFTIFHLGHSTIMEENATTGLVCAPPNFKAQVVIKKEKVVCFSSERQGAGLKCVPHVQQVHLPSVIRPMKSLVCGVVVAFALLN